MRPCCPLVRLGPARELEPRLAQGRGAAILDRDAVRHHMHVGRRAVTVRDEHGLVLLKAERPQARLWQRSPSWPAWVSHPGPQDNE